MSEKERLLTNHPAMQALEKAVIREIWLEKAVALALFVSGCGLMWRCYPGQPLLAGLGVFLAVIGVRFGVSAVKIWQATQHPLLQLLRRQPQRIVWVYSVTKDLMPFGLYIFSRGTFYFQLDDGRSLDLSVPARQLKLISRTLNRLLPEASFGYSVERRQVFAMDPKRLRRSRGGVGEDGQ
ncbi:MAG: hypothetical protein SH848_09905 [Saprospiraceae bacterium]|nr:hypothetical protein [Saprospiraceae bacterium]MDZ4704234.1 hypothetical protein [Saprospiraceae bacterium]